jgi:Uma2 family endonuclease
MQDASPTSGRPQGVPSAERPSRLTQAAEGLPRRAWTVAEIDAMVAAGILTDNERFELIGGEAVPMSAKDARHETVKGELMEFWFAKKPASIRLITETTLRAADCDYRKPDFLFWPRDIAIEDLKPEHIHMLVEVADSSLGYDLGHKARYYAEIGIPEVWVIDAVRLLIHVHREPVDGRYQSIVIVKPGDTATPLFEPSLAVCLMDLGLQPLMD